MTQQELVTQLSVPFYEDFADRMAHRVLGADAVGELYSLVTARNEHLSRDVRHKVFFRGSYVLERIYFSDPSLFAPFIAGFCREDFAACTDASARRHFTKIMAHLLGYYAPPLSDLERIAESAAAWAVDPATKAAVKVWAVEILKCCRARVGWVAESWDDILGAMEVDATPAIRCRLRKSWR